MINIFANFAKNLTVLNFEFFIAKGILSKDKNNFSWPIVKLSVISITLGLAVMIISLAVTMGFKSAITEKVIGFGAHIRIASFDLNRSYETAPISIDQPFYPGLSDSAQNRRPDPGHRIERHLDRFRLVIFR